MYDLPGRTSRRPSPPRQEGYFVHQLLLGVPLGRANAFTPDFVCTFCASAKSVQRPSMPRIVRLAAFLRQLSLRPHMATVNETNFEVATPAMSKSKNGCVVPSCRLTSE